MNTVGKVTSDEKLVLLHILGSVLRRCAHVPAHDHDIDSPLKKMAILTYAFNCLCNYVVWVG